MCISNFKVRTIQIEGTQDLETQGQITDEVTMANHAPQV